MKTLRQILLIWGAALIVIDCGEIVLPQLNPVTVVDFLSVSSSSLLAVVSYLLYRSEIQAGSRLVFFNFALFFGILGMKRSIFQLAMGSFFVTDLWTSFYFYEYDMLLFFLLQTLCVFYLVADHISIRGPTYTRYFATLVVVAGVWVSMFYPFLLDAKYLSHVADYRNFVAVRQSITSLQNEGMADPSTEEIASHTQLIPSSIVSCDVTVPLQKARYVAQLREYMPGYNRLLLLYRPLWLSCSRISVLSVFLVLFCIGHQYFVDRPRGAYMEKIVWCFLPFCGSETLHYYAYTKITEWDALGGIVDIGGYLSLVVMWLIFLLVSLRLWFVQTVEGLFYEHRLTSDPSRITRWRDAFDNWVLKQFMNPGELDRRFLMQRRSEER